MTDNMEINSAEAQEQHDKIGISGGGVGRFKGGYPDRLQWFSKAGLGLFLHMGISSVFGNTDLSWGMIDNYTWDKKLPGFDKITPRRYYKEGSENFTAANYNPDVWLKAAAEAGFKYAVLTTKHHDGYTMWPSRYSEYGVQHSLGGRDLVKPYVDACRKYGLKVGLYYSAPDWYFDREYVNFSGTKGVVMDIDLNVRESLPDMTVEHADKLSAKIRGEVFDLLERYNPDIIWFDGINRFPKGYPEPFTPKELLDKAPQLIINPRFFAEGGDYKTPECAFPKEKIDGMWELCAQITCGGWGYTVHPYKSFRWFTETLCKTRSCGGNFLANVAPDGAGQLPNDYYVRMRQIKEWMSTHKEALFGDFIPNGYDKNVNVPSTKKGDFIYLHIIPTEKPEYAEYISDKAPKGCIRLSDVTEVPYTYEDGKIRISTDIFSDFCADTIKLCF